MKFVNLKVYHRHTQTQRTGKFKSGFFMLIFVLNVFDMFGMDFRHTVLVL